VIDVKLTIATATCETKWENGATLKAFVHAAQPTGWFKFDNVSREFTPVLLPPEYEKLEVSKNGDSVAGQDLQRLGYKQGQVIRNPNQLIYRQKGWNGFEYEVSVSWKYSDHSLVGVWTITSTPSEKETHKTAQAITKETITKSSFNTAYLSHSGWWSTYWSKSSITLPDSILEKQWDLEQYKFGSAARADAPPISLQAVWTADNGKLPPWKGDLHHDLNTQLSYWPAYSANHLDLEEGYLNWLWKYRPSFKKYTRDYFGTSGMNVPGVTTLDGKPMGGWIQYSFGPTIGAWLAHHFYLHWIYSKDEKFLREKAYPWIHDVAIYLDEISVKDEQGVRKLPLSASPEIHDNSIKAWFTQTTNFDLGFIRWTFEKAAELADQVGKKEEGEKWRSILREWPAFALDDQNGLAFAPGHPYIESHRHFSHLVGWHPLGVIDWSKGEKDQQIIKSTLKNLELRGSDWWCGYSYSWLGNLYARAFMGDKAAETLRIFSENFCLPNSFHVNGEQHDKGYSKMKYRPFTLEGNFAFAAGVQEMLIQSHTGIIHLFPAIPASWQELSFTTLRAAGAFLVSAQQKGGKVERVEIVSEQGGICKLVNPFGSETYKISYSWKGKVNVENDTLVIKIPKNGKVILTK
jgi:alpha-L-fucosidase 2